MACWAVPERWVVSDIIDGEAILLDLRFGLYYSATCIGAQIWQSILDGADRQSILKWIARSYPDTSSASTDAEAFLDELVAQGLIETSPDAPALVSDLVIMTMPYERPRLEKYDDMKDLFMLDPIHDVDEVGWPVRKIATSESIGAQTAP